MSLTSKRFSSVAIPLLWNRVFLKDLVTRSFLTALTQSKRNRDYTETGLGGLVRKLYMRSCSYDLHDSSHSAREFGWLVMSHATCLQSINFLLKTLSVESSFSDRYPLPLSWNRLVRLTIDFQLPKRGYREPGHKVSKGSELTILALLVFGLGSIVPFSQWEPTLLKALKEFVLPITTLSLGGPSVKPQVKGVEREFVDLVAPEELEVYGSQLDACPDLISCTTNSIFRFRGVPRVPRRFSSFPPLPLNTKVEQIFIDTSVPHGIGMEDLIFLQSVAASTSAQSIVFTGCIRENNLEAVCSIIAKALEEKKLKFGSGFSLDLEEQLVEQMAKRGNEDQMHYLNTFAEKRLDVVCHETQEPILIALDVSTIVSSLLLGRSVSAAVSLRC